MRATITHELGTYAKFFSLEEAEALLLLLESNEIPYKISRETNQLDCLIIGGMPEPMIAVMLPTDKFEEVNLLVEDSIEGIAPDPVSTTDEIQAFVPEKLHTQWIVLGYVLSIFIVIGILVGITLITSSKRLSDGRKVKMYDGSTIRHGWMMIGVGVFFALLWLVRRIYLAIG